MVGVAGMLSQFRPLVLLRDSPHDDVRVDVVHIVVPELLHQHPPDVTYITPVPFRFEINILCCCLSATFTCFRPSAILYINFARLIN